MKRYDPCRHNRQSIRLPGYDYTRDGAYFVTIVCKDREPLLEDPVYHGICETAWTWLAQRHDFVELDQYVLMPNHLHGIIVLRGDRDRRGGSRTAPTLRSSNRKPLGRLIGAFKTKSTKEINILRGTEGEPIWQRNYHEHIIRDGDELDSIRRYIAGNPILWNEDPEHPANLAHSPSKRVARS